MDFTIALGIEAASFFMSVRVFCEVWTKSIENK